MFSLTNKEELKAGVSAWITSAETLIGKMSDTYIECREYAENAQTPSDKPEDVEYLVRNLITDYVQRKMAKMMSNNIEPELYGIGEMEEPVKELVMEILEQNKFFDEKFEVLADRFEVEGLAGIKLRWNPFKMSVFGLGFPEIFVGKWDNILLDPNASDGTHLDDHVRGWKRRILVKDAKLKYPEFAEQISPFGDQKDQTGQGGTCLEYEIEFKRTILWPHVPVFNAQDQIVNYIPVPMAYHEESDTIQDPQTGGNGKEKLNRFLNQAQPYMQKRGIEDLEGLYGEVEKENIIKIEVELFYRVFVINGITVVSEPEPTDFRRFSVIPLQHIRQESSDMMVPSSRIPHLKDAQDHMNVTLSIMHLQIKREAKNPILIFGAQNYEMMQLEGISDVVPIIKFDNPDAQAVFPPSRQISPHLVEWYQLNRSAFDEIGANMPTERGAAEGDFSGRAILALQYTGDLADFIPHLHIKIALKELITLLVECIINKMGDQPFTIYRKREGEKVKIRYNTYLTTEEDIEKSELEVVNELENSKVINPLKSAQYAKVDIDIEMNVLQKQIAEMQKMALVAADMSREDRLKIVYPKRYKSMLENKEAEDAAVQLVNELAAFGPGVLKITQQFAQLAKGNPQAALGLMQSVGAQRKIGGS